MISSLQPRLALLVIFRLWPPWRNILRYTGNVLTGPITAVVVFTLHTNRLFSWDQATALMAMMRSVDPLG